MSTVQLFWLYLTVVKECDVNDARNASSVLHCYFEIHMAVKEILGKLAVENHFSLSRTEENLVSSLQLE